MSRLGSLSGGYYSKRQLRAHGRRQWKLLACVVAVATLLSGCGSDSIIDDGGTVKRIGDEPQKTLVVWHTYSDEETVVFEKEVIPKFEAEHPGIFIEPVRQTHNQEYRAALLARAAAEKTPDIIRMDYTWVPLFAVRGLIAPLDVFEGMENEAGRMLPAMLETNRYKGKVYGLPLNLTTKAAIYNRELLAKLGRKEAPSSFSELVRLAEEEGLTLGMAGIELWHSLPYLHALGGSLTDDGFTRATGYFDSEASVSAMRELLRLFRAGVLNPQLLGGGADLWKEAYASDRLLMIDEGPWYYSILLNSASVDIDLLKRTHPAPFPSDGRYASLIGGESLVMTKGARNKPEAWTFMSWMTETETQLMLLEAGLIPANTAAFEAARSSSGETSRYLDAYLEGIPRAFYRPAIPQWNEIEVVYDDAMEAIFMGDGDVEAVLREAAKEMDALLEAEDDGRFQIDAVDSFRDGIQN